MFASSGRMWLFHFPLKKRLIKSNQYEYSIPKNNDSNNYIKGNKGLNAKLPIYSRTSLNSLSDTINQKYNYKLNYKNEFKKT